jgi:hypothetical protein
VYLAKDSPEARERACTLINDLSYTKAWELTVKPYRKKRANSQNRFYWAAIIGGIRDATGNDSNDLHEYLLGECFGWQEYQIMDKRKVRPARRSSDMTVEEFALYCEWCISWAGRELGLHIEFQGEGI